MQKKDSIWASSRSSWSFVVRSIVGAGQGRDRVPDNDKYVSNELI